MPINYVVNIHSTKRAIHDQIANKNGDYTSSMNRLENLIVRKKNSYVTIKTYICSLNQRDIVPLFDGLIKKGIRKFHIFFNNEENLKEITNLDDAVNFASDIRYRFIDKAFIMVSGLPKCLFSEPESVAVSSDKNILNKIEKCKICKFYNTCDGIPIPYQTRENYNKIMPALLPEEIAVEISSQPASLDIDSIKKIIIQAVSMKVEIIRLIIVNDYDEEDLYELCRYIKERNFILRLDLSKNNNKKIYISPALYSVDYAIIYINHFDVGKKYKENEIKLLKKAGIKKIRVVTIANMENIRHLRKIYNYILKLEVEKWAVNRDVYNEDIGRRNIYKLVDKLYSIKLDTQKNKYNLRVHMVYAIPFCSYNPIKINYICTGAKSIDGHERIVVDIHGKIRPIHYFDKVVGDYRNIKKAWNNSFLRSIREYKLLPDDCSDCIFLEKCKGGSRFSVYQKNHTYAGPDPLMDLNIKEYFCR